MRFRLLLKNIAANFITRALNLLGTLVIVPLCVQGLGPADYGQLAIVLSATILFAYADLGLGLALVNHLAHADAGDEGCAAVSRTWVMLCGAALLLGTGTILVAVARHWASGFERPIFDFWTVSLLIVAAGLPTALSQRILFAQQRNVSAGIWSGIGRLMSIAGVYAAYRLGGDITAFAAAVLGGPILVGWINNWWLFQVDCPELRPDLATVKSRHMWEDVKVGLHFTTLQLSIYGETGVDNLLIGLFRSPLVVTHYDLTYRLFLYVPSLVTIAAFPLWPALRAAISGGDAAWARRATRLAYAGTALVTLPLALGLLAFHVPLIRLWTGASIPIDWGVATGLAAASVLTSVATIQSLELSAAGQTGVQARVQLMLIPLLVAAKVLTIWTLGLWAFVWALVIYYAARMIVLRRIIRTEAVHGR